MIELNVQTTIRIRGLTMALFEFGDADWTTTGSGVFIPISDLPGSSSSEYADEVDDADKEGQAVFSVIKQIIKKVSGISYLTTQADANLLGISYSLAETLPSVRLKNKTYSFTFSRLVSLDDDATSVIPVATSGTHNGKGGVTLTNIFPNASKLAAASSTGGAGVLILSATLENYGAPSHASLALNNDCRRWIEALIMSVYNR